MNVTTQYNREATFYDRSAPRHYSTAPTAPAPAPDFTVLQELIDKLGDRISDLHALKHDMNMAAWRELYAEHVAAGRHKIADNIMTMKIIPNIA